MTPRGYLSCVFVLVINHIRTCTMWPEMYSSDGNDVRRGMMSFGCAECFVSVHQQLKQQAQSTHENICVLCTRRRQSICTQDRSVKANGSILWD
uniref:Putative secreted protein n=1 Tax=Rhipicephalus microplus TaxID=6941 RepID=A0A6M2DA45_RHIMP